MAELTGRSIESTMRARFDGLLADLVGSPLEEWPAQLATVSLADVAHLVCFDPARYTRTLVAARHDVELLVMGWLPGHASAIHDHGTSQGAAVVLAGEAEEDTFELVDGVPRRKGLLRLRRGHATLERPADVHRVRNASQEMLVTLHAYGPRLLDFRTYELPAP